MNDIVSLCYVGEMPTKEGSARKVLCRIADYEEGFYYPCKYDYSAVRPIPFDDINRDLIFGSQRNFVHDVDTIGLYTWHCEWNDNANRWDTTIDGSPTNIPWIEVFRTHCHSLREVVTLIRSGYPIYTAFDKTHDYVFCIDDSGENAVYVYARQLKEKDGLLFFRDDVQSVLKGSIISRDILSCKCRYSTFTEQTERFYYRRTSKWDPKNIIAIKDPIEIVDDIVRSTVKKAMSRTERKEAFRALDKVNVASVHEQVAQMLHCSTDEASHYAEEYFSSRMARLEADEGTQLIESLLSCDSNLVDQLTEKIGERWQNEHKQRMEQYDSEIAEMKANLDSTTKAASEEEAHLRVLLEQQTAAEDALNKAVTLQQDVEKQIALRLSEMKENTAKVLVDTAFTRITTMSFSSSVAPVAPTPSTAVAFSAPDAVEEIDIAEAFQDAVDYATRFCAYQESASEFVAFIFAVYACNQPLVLAGEYGQALADFYSIFCTGHECTTVTIDERASVDSIIDLLQVAPHDVVCIVDPFVKDYEEARRIMDAFPETRFVFTVRHPESLLMEPRSLFNTFLPVLTEFFCVDAPSTYPEGFGCREALQSLEMDQSDISRAQSRQDPWFTGSFTSPLLRRRCSRLQVALEAICRMVTSNSELAKQAGAMLAFVPLLYYLRNSSGIATLLNELTQIDPERKQMVKLYAELQE